MDKKNLNKVRLNRFIASSGYCSRRKADELILKGRVKVNGEFIKNLGLKINPNIDKVEIDGKLIKPVERKVYIKLYKPRRVLTQLGKDKFGRETLSDLFSKIGIKEKVFPVGRLDYESEGLLILTNDGDFANKIMHPKNKISKRYIVKVKGIVNSKTLDKMKRGTQLEDIFLKPDKIAIVKKDKSFTTLDITIHSGQKRIIRRFMKAFGFEVIKLKRIKIGNIELGNLKPSQWEYISNLQNRI